MDHPYEYDLLCIGAGPAGQRAAVQASKLGRRAAVIEKQRSVTALGLQGGTVPTKTFREAVRSFNRLRRGVLLDDASDDRERMEPDFALLRERIEEALERESAIVEDQLARNEIDLIGGKARFVDPHTVAVESILGGRDVTARYVLVATGTRPAEMEGVEPDGRAIVDAESVLQCESLPREMIVAGASTIGIELGSMFAALGSKVTLVDRKPHPLEFLDASIFEELTAQFERQGMTPRFGTAVAGAETLSRAGARRARVTLEGGERLEADVALFTGERAAATDSLDVEKIGLERGARGFLRVDSDFRTAVESVFAAGEVAGASHRASSAAEQGRIAACRMFGVPAASVSGCEVLGIYSIPEVSMVGATEAELDAQGVDWIAGVARYREIARGAILGDDTGFFKMLFSRGDRKLLGAHCIGTGATEQIHVAQAAISLGATLDYFLSNVFNYPTLAECYKVAAYHAANQLR